MQHPIGMGRGFHGYGAMGPGAAGAPAPGYAGAPGPAPGYGYGMYILLLCSATSWTTLGGRPLTTK